MEVQDIEPVRSMSQCSMNLSSSDCLLFMICVSFWPTFQSEKFPLLLLWENMPSPHIFLFMFATVVLCISEVSDYGGHGVLMLVISKPRSDLGLTNTRCTSTISVSWLERHSRQTWLYSVKQVAHYDMPGATVTTFVIKCFRFFDDCFDVVDLGCTGISSSNYSCSTVVLCVAM